MSVDWSATAAIGVRVKGDALYKKEHVFDSEHARKHGVAEGIQFCSRCGHKMLSVEDVPIEGYDEDSQRFHDFDVVFSTDSKYAVIGLSGKYATSYTGNSGDEMGGPVKITGPDLSEMRNRLYDTLRPLGLWDGNLFGLWSVLHCSY